MEKISKFFIFAENIYIYSMSTWNDLSIPEKAEMMRVAIANGITTLPEIRQAYNQFALGGPGDKDKSILKTVQEKETAFNERLAKPIEIGYDKDRAFTLTNAGSLTGAHLSEEMTDYIIQEAEKAGVDLQTAFGIAAAESTLGNPTDDKSAWNISSGIRRAFNNKYPGTAQHINTYGDVVNEQELLNFYYPLENQNPYTQQIAEAERQARKVKDFEQVLKEGMPYADKLAQKSVPTGSVAQQAFEYFKQNGEGYAPGYKEQTGQSYVQHVKKKGKEALQSPEIQKAITNYALKKIGRPKEYSVGTFNLNPFDWRKKAEGGNLFDGTSQPTQQMNQGYVYDILPRLLKEAGLNVRVTSGYRKAGAAGKAGKKSWHTRHGAVDIVPQGKTTFEDIENALYSNPAIYRYMLTNGLGLLDESGRSAESRATMKKTGASGPHFHIGKDTTPARRYAQRMSGIWDENMSRLQQQINTPQPIMTIPEEIPFTPWNPQALANEQPLVTYTPPTLETSEPLVEVANAYTQEALEKEQRQRNLNTLGFVLGMTSPQGSDNSLASTISMLTGSEFAKGGKIHIKPSHRGRLTELKKRTGKSEAELYKTGGPAVRKMITFARNARKWKHGLGGNLFSGKDTPTQQMNNSLNLYRRTNNLGDVEYIYQETPDSEEILLTPTNKRFSDDPTNWDYEDASGRKYSPRIINVKDPGTISEYTGTNNPLLRAADKYVRELSWRAQNDPSSIALQGKYTMPAIASSALLPVAGEAFAGTTIAGVPATTWANTVLSAGFAGHGLNHTVNEDIDGWEDAAITALEIAPLGKLAKPIYDAGIDTAKTLYDNGTLWDAYTTFNGRFGNYGDDLLTNIYGTAARRLGLPDKPRFPADAIRKISENPRVVDGLIDFTGNKSWFGNPHINLSIDRPVVSHPNGGWDGADTYIFPFKDFIDKTGEALKSIEPSDVFSNGVAFMETPSKVTLISGDVKALKEARDAGMQTLSSPRLRRLYSEAELKYNNKFLNKPPKKEWYWRDYASEIQRLQSQRGTPTYADFSLLQQKTGLNAGVSPLSEYNNAINSLRGMQNVFTAPGGIKAIMNGEVLPYKYPNGREVEWSIQGVEDELKTLQRAKYNKVFYDPSSHVESDWRDLNK